MGKIIAKRIRGMNWMAKISLILVVTLTGVLVYNVFLAYAFIGNGQMVYNINTTTPQARTYTVSSNTFAGAVATVAGGTPKWVKAVAGTARNETVVAYSDTSVTSTLRILHWNGTAWSAAAWTANLSTAAEVARGFDIAVEKNSGDIIVAYTTGVGGTEINFRRWDGSTWTAATNYDSGRLTGTVRFIKMESKPNSDDIALIMADTANDLSAAIWNGTTNAWGNAPTAVLTNDLAVLTAGVVDAESFDLAYESLSGDLLVVYATDAETTGLAYNTFSGGTWSALTRYANMNEAFEHVDCASDPLSDKIICAAVGTATQDMRVGVWDGAAWQGDTTDVDTGAAPATFVAGRKYLSVGWLNAGATKRGIIVYNNNNADAINWVTVNTDGTFAVQADNTAATPMSVGGIAYHDIIMDPYNQDRLLFIFQDTTNFDIFSKRLVMDSAGAFTWSDANAGAVITAAPTTAASEAFHFAYDLYYSLNVGNGTSMTDLNVGVSATNNALDSFTMQMQSGAGTVTSLIVTGSANFTATNIPTNGVKVWRDLGAIGVYDPGVDVLISSASTAIAGNVTTVTISSEPVTTTLQNYLVTIDTTATPTNGQAFTGTVTTVTGVTGVRYQDTTSATLTISTAAKNLTVGNGTNPINKNAQLSSTNNALDGLTLGLSATSSNSTITSLTVTGSANFTATNVPTGGVKVWRDTGTTVGYWDAGDTLISSASTAIAGNATTVTISSEAITYPAKNYLVTVDITAGATPGQSFTATVTAAAGTNLGTPVYSDSSSATLTVNKLLSTNTTCGSCHAYPPLDASSRDAVSGAFVGDHQKGGHQVVCSTCHVAPATQTSADFAHRNENIQMQTSISGGTYSKGTSFAQSNSPTTGTCSNVACHGGNNPTPQWGVGTATCVDCHNGVITRTMAAGTLDNVVAEFGLPYGHKKSGRGAVTAADCIVCHLEGNFTTQGPSTYHANGNIDLRNPDGVGEVAITNITGGAFTFTKFATSYAAGSRTTTGHTSNNVDNVLTQKFCLACHDSNGATNTTARTSGGTQYMPWGGVNLGANYTLANGAASVGGLIDAKTQFATGNISRHPVLGPRSAGYPTTALMIAPYNNFTRTAGTLANSVVMNCFDCHNVPGASPLTTRTVAAHGNANTIRGVAQVSVTGPTVSTGTTLCLVCHQPTSAGGLSHQNGSGFFTAGRAPMDVYLQFGCNMCHGSGYSAAQLPARPVVAQNSHGFTTAASGPVSTKRAFFRGNTTDAYVTDFFPGSCTGMGGTICAGARTKTYTPGGVY